MSAPQMHTHVVTFGTKERQTHWPAWKQPDGSVLVDLRLHGKPTQGCGKATHVSGTNGGTMPCGAMLTAFGSTKPYYCAACLEKSAQERVYDPDRLQSAGVPRSLILDAGNSSQPGLVLLPGNEKT